MTKTQTLKGFRDFLPGEAKKRQWLKNRISEVFELWGYDPLETPTLEPLELFAGQIGDDEKLFFRFKDNGGRNVALRYDQTVPTCRVVGNNFQSLIFPFRRYQIQSAFRAENTQKGRYREFLQCDADIFGIPSPYADAEVIALSLDIYRQLGFRQAQVLINDRDLLKNLPYKALSAIDKLDKIGEAGVVAEMERANIPLPEAKEYLTQVKNLKPNETIKLILESLKNYGFDSSWFMFKPTLARSFAYSSGPIWEVNIPELGSLSVLGGERFDNLIRKISEVNIPATGFGLGFDRTLEAAESLGLIPEIKVSTTLLVTVFSPDLYPQSLKTSQALRSNKIATELYPDPNTKLDKQLKYASAKGIPYVLIIGEKEIADNTYILKNMAQRSQTTLPLEKIISLLANTSAS